MEANHHPCGAQLDAIHRISSALFAQTDVDLMLIETLEVSVQTAGAETGSILFYERSTKQLVFRHALGPVGGQLVGQTVNPGGSGKCATVFRTGVSDISAEGFDEPAITKGAFQTRSTLTTAIKNYGGDPVGVVQVVNKLDGVFDSRDQELLEIVSALAATVIENAARVEERKEAALARILMFIGHQLKNQAFIISMSEKTYGPDIDAAVDELERRNSAEARDITKGVKQYRSDVNVANNRATKLARAINEYADRRDLFEFKVQDLRAPIEEELSRLVALAPEYGGRIDLSELKDVPAIACDAFFVSQAIYNLVDNAGDAAREGPPWQISVATEACAEGSFPDGNYVEIKVQDNGPGIAPEKLEKILRGEAEKDPHKQNSTGVGTRLVHSVAHTHGGLFMGESELGVGTTFRLRIPMALIAGCPSKRLSVSLQ